MSFLIESYQRIQKELSVNNVILVAVTKTKPVSMIMEAYDAGHRDFGENYVQELLDKQEALPKDIRWHFIGHLQSNKVKFIAPFVHLIHGMDSEKLLNEINKQGKKINRIIPCLLQIHIAAEETKFGLNETELEVLMTQIKKQPDHWNNISIKGLMGMASFTEDNDLIKTEFNNLKSLFDKYPTLKILSMGMSADYRFGIEAGSNMVRIGSLLFGSRIII